jgi:hypothetical protein
VIVLYAFLTVLYLPIAPVLWLLARRGAKRCPECKCRWASGLVEEGVWHCGWCGNYWETR